MTRCCNNKKCSKRQCTECSYCLLVLRLCNQRKGSAEERLDASSSLAQTSSAGSDLSSSRAKRGGYQMNRYNRGLHMLRLGKRADDVTSDDTKLSSSPEFLEYLLEHYYPFVYPGGLPGDDDTVDGEGEVYSPQDAGLFEDFVDDGGEEGLEQQTRFRRSESSTPADPAELSTNKRQDEENNDQFTDDGQWSSYPDNMDLDDIGMDKRQLKMLRLGKRQMKMLRLGKRQMKMLRLGKRPMKMLRLGKRPMKMLRLGKRPMKMLRLGKRPMKMLRLGKRPMKMLRLGKRPMKMLRLGKRQMKMLRLGKRSTESEESEQSNASA